MHDYCVLCRGFMLLGVLAVAGCSQDVDEPNFGDPGGGAMSGGSSDGGGGDGGSSDGSGGGTGSGGGSTCGNGTLDATEQCDGTNLGGETCESLGEGTGTLACDPVMCTYDTSMCTGMSSSSTSG